MKVTEVRPYVLRAALPPCGKGALWGPLANKEREVQTHHQWHDHPAGAVYLLGLVRIVSATQKLLTQTANNPAYVVIITRSAKVR